MNGAGQFYDRHFIDNPLSGVDTSSVNLPSEFRPDISTWAQLADVVTSGASLPVILEWYDTAASLMRTTVLQASTAATDTSLGVQRPNDYSDPGNTVAWFQIGGAG